MPLRYRDAEGEVRRVSDDGAETSALTLLILLADRPPAKLRKKLGLLPKSTLLDALARDARIAPVRLAPLARLSSGIYTEDDYLSQFDEDWEVEEYGGHAREAVERNLAAWQDPGPLLEALDAAIAGFSDPKVARSLLPDESERWAPDALRVLRERVAAAIERAATSVCLEIDDDL